MHFAIAGCRRIAKINRHVMDYSFLDDEDYTKYSQSVNLTYVDHVVKTTLEQDLFEPLATARHTEQPMPRKLKYSQAIEQNLKRYDVIVDYTDFQKRVVCFYNELFAMKIVNAYKRMHKIKKMKPHLDAHIVCQLKLTHALSKVSGIRLSDYVEPSARLRNLVLQRLGHTASLHPEIAQGMIDDMRITTVQYHDTSKTFVVIDDTIVMPLCKLLVDKATPLDMMSMYSQYLISNPDLLMTKIKSMYYDRETVRLEGGKDFGTLVKTISTELLNRLAGMNVIKNVVFYSSLSLDIYNIITNCVSIYFGEGCVRVMNVIALLANLMRFSMTLYMAIGIDWDSVIESNLTDLFYKWFAVKLDEEPALATILDDDTREKVDIIAKDLREKYEETPTVKAWETLKSLFAGRDDLTVAQQEVMSKFDANFALNDLTNILYYDEIRKYQLELQNYGLKQVRSLKFFHETGKVFEECDCSVECRCFLKMLDATLEYRVDETNGCVNVYDACGTNIKEYDMPDTECAKHWQCMPEMNGLLKYVCELPEYISLNKIFTLIDNQVRLESKVDLQKWLGIGMTGLFSLVALGICIYANKQTDTKGKEMTLNNNFAASLIQFGTLKKTMKDMWGDGDDLWTTVKNAFDTTLASEEEKCVAEATFLNQLLNSFMSLTDTQFLYHEKLIVYLESTLKQTNHFLTTRDKNLRSQNLDRAYTILMGTSTAATTKLQYLVQTVTSNRPKQPVTSIWIYGANGAGKGYFVEHKLNEYMRERFGTKDVYQISFGGQPEYFPASYADQEVCMFDEFLQMRDDPMLSRINTLDSTSAVAIPGASISSKDRTAQIKMLILVGNAPNLQDAAKQASYSHAGLTAINSKMIKFRFENKLDDRNDTAIGRNLVKHEEDYSHLQIYRVYHGLNGENLQEEEALTIEEFLTYIGDEYQRKAEIFKRLMEKKMIDVPKIDVEEYNPVNFKSNLDKQTKLEATSRVYTVLFTGEAGRGKTFTGRSMANRFSKTLKMPILYVTAGNIDKIRPAAPSICVVDDALCDELKYMEFWDSVPEGSLILNCANLVVRDMKWYDSTKARSAWNFSTTWLDFATRLIGSTRFRYRTIKNNGATVTQLPQPGFIRRIGLTGLVNYGGSTTYISPESGCNYIFGDGFTKFNGEGTLVSDEHVYSEIYRGYIAHKKEAAEIVIDPPTTLLNVLAHVSIWPKVVIRSPSPGNLQTLLNSAHRLIKAQARGSALLKQRPELTLQQVNELDGDYVFIHHDVLSSFTNTVEAFRIPEGSQFTSTEIKEFANRTYKVLKECNAAFDVYVDCGEVFVSGSGGVIKHHLAYEAEIEGANDFTFEKKTLDNQTVFLIKNETETITLDVRSVAKIVNSGLQNLRGSVNWDFCKQSNFMRTVTQIYQDPAFHQTKKNIEMQKIACEILKDQELANRSYWDWFKSTKYFTALKIIGIILGAVGSIVMIWMCFHTMFKPSKINTTVYLDGRRYDLSIQDKKLEVTKGLDNTIDEVELYHLLLESVPAYLQSFDQKSQATLTRQLVVKAVQMEGEYNDIKPKGKGVVRPRIAIENYVEDSEKRPTIIKPTVQLEYEQQKQTKVVTKPKVTLNGAYTVGPRKNLFVNNTLQSIVDKVDEAICAIVNPESKVGSAHGLFIKGRYFICNAHVVKGARNLQVFTDYGHYLAVVHFLDETNDFALCEVIDKTCKEYKDISGNFVSEERAPNINKTITIRQHTVNGIRTRTVVPGINVYDQEFIHKDSIADIKTNVHYVQYHNHSTFKSLTGYCGYPYIATDNTLSGKIITGIHLGSTSQRAISNIVTSEYLAAAMNACNLEGACLEGESLGYTDVSVEVVRGGEQHQYDNFVVEDGMLELISQANEGVLCDELFEESNWLTPVGVLQKGNCTYHSPKHAFELAPWANRLRTPKICDLSALVNNDSRIINNDQLIIDSKGQKNILYTQIAYHNEPTPLEDKFKLRIQKAVKILAAEYKQVYGSEIPMLTKGQAINSVYDPSSEFYNCLPNLEQKASTGFYVSTVFGKNTKEALLTNVSKEGERPWYKFADNKAANWVEQQYDNFFEYAKQGKTMLDIGKASLKSEVLKQEKVDNGLTRLFSPRGVVSTLVERRVFGAFMGKIKEHRSEGFCQVGIDPLVDFTQLYHRFAKTGTKAICLDFKRWDKHILPELIEAAFALIYECMKKEVTNDEDEKYNEELRCILNAITQTFTVELVFADKQLFFRTIGMPSGTVLTSVINSIINDIILYVFMVTLQVELNMAGEKINVYKEIDRVHYGDDLIIIVSANIADHFTPQKYSDFVETVFSIESTAPTKDGSGKRFCTLEEIDFLSQAFIPCPEKQALILPKLKIMAITKQLYFWSNYQPLEIKEKINGILQYACAHSRDFYNQTKIDCKAILDYCKEVGWRVPHPNMFDYETQRSMLLTKIDPTYGSGETLTERDLRKLSRDNSFKPKQGTIYYSQLKKIN